MRLVNPAFVYLGSYFVMAVYFIQDPSLFILRGEPWNERIFIRKITYEAEDDSDNDYDDYSNWNSR
jgi:hypothetical protein